MTTPAPTLPIELIEAIIDHQTDKKSLKACSLVCKAWTSRARFHLFAFLNLRRRDVETFINSRPPINIAPFVRSLRLTTSYWYTDSGPWDEIIPRLVDFHHVRHLGLVGVELKGPTSDICLALGQFAHIVDLRLTEITWPSFASFADVLCAFPSLEKLCLISVRWSNSNLPAPSHSPLRNLHALQVCGCHDVHKWLLSLHAIPALRSLYWCDCDLDSWDEDEDTTIKLLKALSPFLEALVVSPWISYYSFGMSIVLASIHAIRPG